MRYLISLILFTFSSVSGAQSLTLEESVLGQYRQFAPDGYNGIQWIGSTKSMAYYSDRYDKIMRMDIGKTHGDTWITLESVNKATKANLRHLFGTQIIDNNNIIVSNSKAFYSFNPIEETGEKILSFPKDAENTHFKNNKLAYTLGHNLYLADNDHSKIPVTNFMDKNIVSGQAIARSEFGITNGIFWSPSGKFLAFYQKNEVNVSDYPLLDISTTPGNLINIKYPMAGQKSEQARIGIYSLETKKTIYLTIDGDPEQYLTNLSWGPEEKFIYVAIINRDQNAMKLVQFDASKGVATKTLFEEKHAKYVEPEFPLWFMPNSNDKAIWLSEKDGFMHAYTYDFNTGRLEQLTKGNWAVKQILGLDDKQKSLLVSTTDPSGLNTLIRKVDLKKKTITIITKTKGVHSTQLGGNNKFLLNTYSNLETPKKQYVSDLNGKMIGSPLSEAKTPYKKGQLGITEFIDLKTKDGTTLHARMIKPSNFDPNKKYPVLVYVYGGPHAQMITNSWLGGASLWMHYMAQKGYIIWTLDNRGSANRGRDFENIIHRQLGTIEARDQMTGVEYLKKQPYVDSDKMAIHGWSFGGFMTITMMLKHANTFKVGVAGGPVTDWSYYEIMYGERYMDRPEENPEGYADAKLHNHVTNLKGELLLIHGTIDDVVVMQHNLTLVKSFVDEGILVDFFPYPGHPHNVRGKDRVHLMNKVLTYIENKLKD